MTDHRLEIALRHLTRLLPAVVLALSASCDGLDELLPSDPAARRDLPPAMIEPDVSGVAYERFIAIGDMGTGLPGQRKVAGVMATRAEENGLDFIVTLGDNIYPDGVTSATDAQWQTKFERVYDAPALQVPFYATLGNHDHGGNPQAQIDYGLNNPNWRMPARYYTFSRDLADGTTTQFFALDTTAIKAGGPDSVEQLAWLEEELAQSEARWRIVFGHHTVYGHNAVRGHSQRMINRLEPLLVEHQVDLYLAGHDHALEMIKPIHGVHYVISGAAGGPLLASAVEWTDEVFYAATRGGFVLLRISRDAIDIEFVRMNAVTQYAHRLTKED